MIALLFANVAWGKTTLKGPPKALFLYAPADRNKVRRFDTALGVLLANRRFLPLNRQGIADNSAASGTLLNEMQRLLPQADVVFCVLSPNFTANAKCSALARKAYAARSEGKHLVPVMLEPTDLGDLLPRGVRKAPTKLEIAVSEYSDADAAWLDVSIDISRVLSSLTGRPPAY
ncbi:MAG: toll/interleukin-1 receptor domain-containing protein [Deltaproteobacteria bacterium]|nr:toll/interleukin-1 receptor domain-containing protein [Deltaproteobacteria bacterium]